MPLEFFVMPRQLQDWWYSYCYITDHIIPGPRTISYFAIPILLTGALLIPPSMLSKNQLVSLFLLIIYGCFAHSCIYGGGIDIVSANLALWATTLIGIHDPRRAYKWIRRGRDAEIKAGVGTSLLTQDMSSETKRSKKAKGLSNQGLYLDSEPSIWEQSYPSTFFDRIPWAFALIFSVRLHNWKIGIPQHDSHQPSPTISRRSYLLRSISITICSLLILDTAAYYVYHDPYFHHSSLPITYSHYHPIYDTPGIGLLEIYPWNFPLKLYKIIPACVIRSLTLAGHIYALLTLPSAVFSPFFLFLSDDLSPHTHPPFFGPFSSIYKRGLRGLWGQWWHQIMRYPTSLPGATLACSLQLEPGGRGEYILRVISAFGLSGWIHMGLVPPAPIFAKNYGKWGIRGWIAGFFWIQIVGIVWEIWMETLWKQGRWGRNLFWTGKAGRRLKGSAVFLWVLFWVIITVPMVGVAGKELGWFRNYPLPVSLWMGFMYKRWLPWVE
jgi:hypothetical protein